MKVIHWNLLVVAGVVFFWSMGYISRDLVHRQSEQYEFKQAMVTLEEQSRTIPKQNWQLTEMARAYNTGRPPKKWIDVKGQVPYPITSLDRMEIGYEN